MEAHMFWEFFPLPAMKWIFHNRQGAIQSINGEGKQLDVNNHLKGGGIKAILGIGLCLLPACSGGGSGTVAAASNTPPAVSRLIQSNTLRAFVHGDQIQYTLTGNIISAGGVATTLTGTASYVIATHASPMDPTGVIRSTSELSIAWVLANGTPISSIGTDYFSQTATGTKNVYGTLASGWITTPASGFVTTLLSPIILPSSWNVTYTQQNGDVTSSRVSVVSKANVITGMGTFEAFKYQTDTTTALAVGGKLTSTVFTYVVPAIGPIMTEMNLTVTNALGAVTSGVQMTLTASTTNIPF